jgi:hypothetical protein
MNWPDGQTYAGGFENNERSGRGVQTSATGEIIHCGLWKNDNPVGPTEDTAGLFSIPQSVMVNLQPIDDCSLMGPERDICSDRMVVGGDDEDDLILPLHRPVVTA